MENEENQGDLIYNVRLNIRQKSVLPDCSPVDVESIHIELMFKSVPTYRRIHEVVVETYQSIDFLEGFDSDDKPEFGMFNRVGSTEITMCIDRFNDV